MGLARNQYRVLGYLAARGGDTAGIDVANAIEGLGRSSVYAALAALQRDGFVDARWDHSQPHPRRLVRINSDGRQVLAAEQRLSLQPATHGVGSAA